MSTDLYDTDLYDTDLYAWATNNAALIRAGRLAEVDFLHIAEELESMGRSERRAITSRLEVLLMHLLKWRLQPGRQSRSWQLTIKEQRRRLARLLAENPSLQADLPAILADAYPDAVLSAARETGLEEASFPDTCPFALADVLDAEHWPEPAA